jgi:integrase
MKAEGKEPLPTDPIFPKTHRELFNTILEEEHLKKDREGLPRTAYSLRHTYICLRLMEGADIYQIAKNCRTSVEMIEKYYASHIKTSLDAAAINIRKKKPAKKAATGKQPETED